MRRHIQLEEQADHIKDTKKEYDYINPDHYKRGSKEVIDMMIDLWGKEAVMLHCEITAFKYRMRLGNKPGQPIERDFEKALWYEQKAQYLRSEISKKPIEQKNYEQP